LAEAGIGAVERTIRSIVRNGIVLAYGEQGKGRLVLVEAGWFTFHMMMPEHELVGCQMQMPDAASRNRVSIIISPTPSDFSHGLVITSFVFAEIVGISRDRERQSGT
jgi:hypothetical protein